MKGKLKTIAFLLVLILLCSIIAPTMNVFAETSTSTIEFLVSREDGNEFFGDLKITEDINDEDNNPSTVYKIHIQADFGSAFAENGIKINNDTMPVSEGTEEINYYMETPVGNNFDIVLKYVSNLNRNFTIIWVYNTDEVIETIYDESTNTITFSTSSFSNYAIASKKTENTTNTEIDNKVDNTTNPQTGDNIIMFIIIFVIALTGILVTCIISRKRVKNNK